MEPFKTANLEVESAFEDVTVVGSFPPPGTAIASPSGGIPPNWEASRSGGNWIFGGKNREQSYNPNGNGENFNSGTSFQQNREGEKLHFENVEENLCNENIGNHFQYANGQGNPTTNESWEQQNIGYAGREENAYGGGEQQNNFDEGGEFDENASEPSVLDEHAMQELRMQAAISRLYLDNTGLKEQLSQLVSDKVLLAGENERLEKELKMLRHDLKHQNHQLNSAWKSISEKRRALKKIYEQGQDYKRKLQEKDKEHERQLQEKELEMEQNVKKLMELNAKLQNELEKSSRPISAGESGAAIQNPNGVDAAPAQNVTRREEESQVLVLADREQQNPRETEEKLERKRIGLAANLVSESSSKKQKTDGDLNGMRRRTSSRHSAGRVCMLCLMMH